MLASCQSKLELSMRETCKSSSQVKFFSPSLKSAYNSSARLQRNSVVWLSECPAVSVRLAFSPLPDFMAQREKYSLTLHLIKYLRQIVYNLLLGIGKIATLAGLGWKSHKHQSRYYVGTMDSKCLLVGELLLRIIGKLGIPLAKVHCIWKLNNVN